MGKKSKKRRQKVARKIDSWLEESELTEEELMLAGLGVMARAVEKKQRKLFDRAMRTGRKIADLGLEQLSSDQEQPDPSPVIAYRPHGGGWYAVEIDDVLVERVHGEEAAAARAAQLFQAYASLDADEQAKRTTAMVHTGGGWYDVIVNGVPVEKVRGREAAEERFAEIQAA